MDEPNKHPYFGLNHKTLAARVSGKLLRQIGKVRQVEELSEADIIRDALRMYVNDKINSSRPAYNRTSFN